MEGRIQIGNRIKTRQQWLDQRKACEADLGAFHGQIASETIHWFDHAQGPDGAWICYNAETKSWSGWDAKTLAPVPLDLDDTYRPWKRDFVGDNAPLFKWFDGGLTNACFNEVDRHVLAGYGDEAALIFEGDRWDSSLNQSRGGPVESYEVSRKKLLLETAKCALVLKKLGLGLGDRIAINMPNIPQQIFWIEAAKRLGILYTPVFGGFSDKTLSDRIHDFGARVVVTADGGHRNSQIIPFKTSFTDPALDNFIGVDAAINIVTSAVEALTLSSEDASTILSEVKSALAGETTVERSDIMRGVGRAVAKLSIDTKVAADTRAHIAGALVQSAPRVDTVIVERHASQPDMLWRDERDQWAHDLKGEALGQILAAAQSAGMNVATEDALLDLPDTDFVKAIWASCPPVPVDAECPMFVIYTSGSTGKPKGVVHVHGGYLSGIASTMPIAFGTSPGDVIYVVADPGWITGQSYLIAAPLATRVTTVIAEGAPVYPHAGRFASIIERYKVNVFKAGVTFLKSVMQDPESINDVRKYDLSSLHAATFCAEPTSPSVQEFGMKEITPFYMNSYWATEHGGMVWTHFADNDEFPLTANAHAYPLPWVFGDIWVDDGSAPEGDAPQSSVAPVLFHRPDNDGTKHRSAYNGEKGEIVITAPYPYLARTVWGDVENFEMTSTGPVASWSGDTDRYANTYWKRWQGVWAYTQGDFGMPHTDGSISIHGRSDDVINVSGHRLGTEEIEGAILKDKANNPAGSPVGNVIVVGAPHREKGLTPLAFVKPTPGMSLTSEDKKRLSNLVRSEKGSLAIPADFIETPEFPETRSGKYMRRMVRALVEDAPLGDVSTLKNPSSLDDLKRSINAWQKKQSAAADQEIFERYRFFEIQYNALDQAQKVATVFVNNPPVNALNERALDELNTIVDHLDRRKDIAAVVFTGKRAGVFVAGADIRQFLDEINTLSEARALPNNAHLAFKRIEAMDKPCIAAIGGVALGGGMEFALACHYRIAEPYARFGQPEIRLRLMPGYGGTQRLPRLMADANGHQGLIDSLELILGGRSIDADTALSKRVIDEISNGASDCLGRAHELVRHFVKGVDGNPLQTAIEKRRHQNDQWKRAADIDLSTALADNHLEMIERQSNWAGRANAFSRCVDAIRTGWTNGIDAGLEREAELFAEAVIDPEGGKTGIRQFMEKQGKPLPIRRDGVQLPGDDSVGVDGLVQQGELLPVGAPFFPGVTQIPRLQFAHGVYRDQETGEPRFGPPQTAEKQILAPVPTPSANEALIYVLASEVNFNDIWAITGIPVSSFDGHEEDIQTTGSGGIALVAALGEEVRREGRVKVGDLVAVYSGTNDLLSPTVGLDPMYADFSIQGYETPTGSHAQFLVCQAPQLHHVRADLTLEQAGAFTLNLGTVVRALFTTLKIRAGRTVFVEGAATGTGFDALKSSIATGLSATGLVSSDDRAQIIRDAGAVCAINRKSPELSSIFTSVPENADEANKWEQAGEPLLDAFRKENGGKLADYAVSHAGETAFPRTFQLLDDGGVVAFYGASSGYHFTFMGKDGGSSPGEMLARCGLRGDQSVLVFYGPASDELNDPVGLEVLEEIRAFGARAVVTTTTDGQRDFVLSLGFEDAVAGVVSLETLKRRLGDAFDWPLCMPRLPDSKTDTEAFKRAVRDFQERTMKPFGGAVGKILRSPDNPRGAPDVVFERAAFDSLGVSSALVKPYTGCVVYSENLKGRRFSFYAPQVWTRQRRIVMPTAEIRGTHLCNAYEAAQMHDLVAAGVLSPTQPTVVPWDDLPKAHQSMWDNVHAGATYVVNHALPELGLKSRDELFEAWSSKTNHSTTE